VSDQTLTKQLIAANAALLAASQTPVSGTPLTLTGTALDTARRILLTFGNEVGNRTLLLTGTNGSGTAITETLAIASGGSGTIASLQDFATLSSALPLGGGWSAAATLGTNTTGSSVWWLPDNFIPPFEVAAGLELLSGAATVSVECTDDGILMPLPIYQTGYSQAVPIPVPFSWPGLTNAALTIGSPTTGLINRVCRGIRLTINSGTGQVRLRLRQAGITY